MDATLFSSPTWFYIDSDGHERGPFGAEDMLGWFSDGYFPTHLLVRRNCHSNFTTLSSLALGNAVKPIVNVHPAEKPQKPEEAKSSGMSEREIKEEYIEREIKKECIKTEFKVKCLKPEIKKEYIKFEMEEECAKLQIKKEPPTLGSGTEGEYIEPEISKEWLKLASKEECIETEIKEECIKLGVKEEYINPEIKDKYLNPELKREYRKPEVKIEHAEQKMKEECTGHVRKVPHSLKNMIKDIFGNPHTQEEITNVIQNDQMEDGEIPSSADDVNMDAQGGAEDGAHHHRLGQVSRSLRPLMIPPPPPDGHSAFIPIQEYQGGEKRKLESEKKEERIIERDANSLPIFRANHVTVCSTTLWIGNLTKNRLLEKEDLFQLFRKFGEVISIDLIFPRGCAYVVMKRRTDADKALKELCTFRLFGKQIKIAWGPGKKVKDMKDYFDFDLGAFFIPLDKLDLWLRLSTVD